VTATAPNLFQAPFRAGIKIDAYQMEPLRKATGPAVGADVVWRWRGHEIEGADQSRRICQFVGLDKGSGVIVGSKTTQVIAAKLIGARTFACGREN
jgi:hypothetical protein